MIELEDKVGQLEKDCRQQTRDLKKSHENEINELLLKHKEEMTKLQDICLQQQQQIVLSIKRQSKVL